MDRRAFLKGAAGACLGGLFATPEALASGAAELPEGYGMLVDTTVCIGCRKCEWACAREHETSDASLETYEDLSVFDTARRMDPTAFTVVNQHANPNNENVPVYIKQQCMHCLDPACVSACLVGALEKHPDGPVHYDAWKCIGCRYCMVACPFEVPTYEFSDPLTPRVRKCTFCKERITEEGKIPACAEICPPNALVFGKREELLELAHQRLADEPERYHNKVYGEHTVGGTSWLYIGPKPIEEMGMPELGEKPIPELTETIQHSVFKYGIPPLLVLGVLGSAMRSLNDKAEDEMAGKVANGSKKDEGGES